MQRVHVAASIKVRKRDQLRMQVRDTESAVLENPGGARRAMARTRTEQTREQVQTKHRARAMSLLRAGYDRSEANDPLDRAAATIQRAVRTQLFAGHRSTCAVRLHCKRLAERLLYGKGAPGVAAACAPSSTSIDRVRLPHAFIIRICPACACFASMSGSPLLKTLEKVPAKQATFYAQTGRMT